MRKHEKGKENRILRGNWNWRPWVLYLWATC